MGLNGPVAAMKSEISQATSVLQAEGATGPSRKASILSLLALSVSLVAPAYFSIDFGLALLGLDPPIAALLAGLFPKCVVLMGGEGLRPNLSCVSWNITKLVFLTSPVALVLGVASLARALLRRKVLGGEGFAAVAVAISGMTMLIGALLVVLARAWLGGPSS